MAIMRTGFTPITLCLQMQTRNRVLLFIAMARVSHHPSTGRLGGWNLWSAEIFWAVVIDLTRITAAADYILNMSKALGEQVGNGRLVLPYVFHGHCVDAGDIAALLSGALNVPMEQYTSNSDRHTISADSKLYAFKNQLITVGGRPTMLIIPRIEHVVCYDIAPDLPSKPEKIAIVGGGYIALEFAGTFNGLKGEVHVFIRQKEVLSGFDEEVIDFIAEQMSLRGITFHTEHGPLAMSKSNDGLLPLKTNKKTIGEFMYVMFATGRRPNTRNLGLEEIGVKMDKNRAIMVDEYSRALVDSVWAVGDATVRINLSLVVLMDGGALAKIALGVGCCYSPETSPQLLHCANRGRVTYKI
ncbi:hypothetical protein ABZP36_023785 [Zizania latifolia]